MTFSFEDCQRATVRIYNSDSGTVCGAGFLVHAQYVMTCAHVVNDALGMDVFSQTFPPDVIELDFPKATDIGKIMAKVIVWRCPSEFDPSTSDIALLRLHKQVSIKPMPLKNPLEISEQKSISEDLFKIWGFPSGYDQGLATEGKIVTEEQLRIDINMPRIIGGFSGSPVWDISTRTVVGMVVETDTRDQTTVDDYGTAYDADGFDGRTAFACKLKVLSDIWYKQGIFSQLCRQYKLWKQHREVLLDAYYGIPKITVDDEPDSLDILLVRVCDQRENLLYWVLYLYVHLSSNESLKKNLIQKLKFIYPMLEIKNQYSRLKQDNLSEKSDNYIDQIESRLWIFFRVLDNPDQLQLSACFLIKNKNINISESINLISNDIFTRENISQKISPILQSILSQAKKHGKYLIEIFLPYEFLDLNPDVWLLKDKVGFKSLGSSHPVVIRILDRVIEDDEFADEWKNWHSQWNSTRLGSLCHRSLICCDRPGNELHQALELKKVMGLSIKSPPETHDNEPLPMIMRKGVAIALWLRKRLDDCQAQGEYQRILSGTKLCDLPQELKFMRNADPKNPDHLARHLTLLWDDPTVIPPPDFNFSFVNTVQKL